jgi:hypothetical protein
MKCAMDGVYVWPCHCVLQLSLDYVAREFGAFKLFTNSGYMSMSSSMKQQCRGRIGVSGRRLSENASGPRKKSSWGNVAHCRRRHICRGLRRISARPGKKTVPCAGHICAAPQAHIFSVSPQARRRTSVLIL